MILGPDGKPEFATPKEWAKAVSEGLTSGPMPLQFFPEEARERIEQLARQSKPPPRWLQRGLVMIPSRAYHEWRRLHPGRRKLDRDVRAAVIARDGLICGICKGALKANEIHIDHIVAVCRGGTDSMANLRVTHARCNLQKGGR